MDKQTEDAFIARVRKLMHVAQSFHGEERGDDAISALACIALLLDELLLDTLEPPLPASPELLLPEESEPPQALSAAADSAMTGRMICRYENMNAPR